MWFIVVPRPYLMTFSNVQSAILTLHAKLTPYPRTVGGSIRYVVDDGVDSESVDRYKAFVEY